MRRFREWNWSAQTLTGSVIGLLLSIGLCSVGTKWEQTGTRFQDAAAGVGLILFLISSVMFVISLIGGLIVIIIRASSSDK